MIFNLHMLLPASCPCREETTMAQILLLDGDACLWNVLCEVLESEGYTVYSPTATLLEHALLAQGFMGISKVAFPRRLQLPNRDSTGAKLSNAIKCRCRDMPGFSDI